MRCLLVVVTFGLFSPVAWSETPKTVVINEFMASNTKTWPDEQGQYDDWIELYNTTDQHIDLAGWFLTDDLANPTKWQFPLDDPLLTIIPAKGFLLLWADGDRGEDLHAGFSLSAEGEQLALLTPDGVLVDFVRFGRQRPDVSYGRWPDGQDNWQYMTSPSPTAKNGKGLEGIVEDVLFSPARGFCDEPVTVTLTCDTPGAQIWYTLDADTPRSWVTDSRGQRVMAGQVYTGPIQLNHTTCIRAVAVRSGWLDSSVVSHTYIFPDDVIRQPANPPGFPATWGSRQADYAMDQRVVEDPRYKDEIKQDLKSTPSVCIVIPNADFFGPSGIYANATRTGPEWERAASFEFIDPASGEQFGVNAGLRIHGGPYGRSGNPKNALRVIFRSEYGPARLEYPLFPDTEVRSFNTIVLRSIWNYSWSGHSGMSGPQNADYLRDAFARDTIRDMGRLTPHGRPVQVYINGLYWGLYIMAERPDEHFAAGHLGGKPEDYDMLEAPSGMGASTLMEFICGDEQAVRQAWNTLFAIADKGFADATAYRQIQQYIDITTMIDYMLMIYYTGSRDAPVFLGDSYTPRNFYVVRTKEPPSPFLIIPWDTEWALEEPTVNRVPVVGVWNPHYLMDKLSANPEFKVLLADCIHKQFYNDGALTREATTNRYLARAMEIYGAIVGESARWGDVKRPSMPYTRQDWEQEVNRLVNQYFSSRTQTVIGQLRQRGWYPAIEAPILQIDGRPQHGGHVDVGATLSMSNPNNSGQIYYCLDGQDPRLPAGQTQQVQTIVLVPEDAAKRVLVPTRDIGETWRGGAEPFDDSGWNDAVINPAVSVGGVGYETQSGYEGFITYDVRDAMYGKNGSCYIRVPFDIAATDLAIINTLTLKVRCDDGFVAYINGIEVASINKPENLAWNSTCENRPDSTDLVEFILNDTSMLHPGRNILAVQAINQSLTSSDLLFSAELVGSSQASADPRVNPAARQYTGPIRLERTTRVKARVLGSDWSPLKEAVFSVGPVADWLRITEIMYHPVEPNCEFLELTNTGTQTISLDMVRFTRGIDFTFPPMDLTPGQYVLVVKDKAAFESIYGPGLPIAGQYTGSLDNVGERLEVSDAAGQRILQIDYSDAWYPLTDGMGFSLVLSDPGVSVPVLSDRSAWRPSAELGGSPGRSDDLSAIPGPGAIVINEIMARPGGNRPDWIELYNSTDKPIAIGGWYLSDDLQDLTKYTIPAGTTVPPMGYKVLYQDVHFGNAFGLSSDGEQVVLVAGKEGRLAGFMVVQSFGPSETGISLGRYVKSNSADDFVAMATPTPGTANSAPRVGPVVMCEVMYNVRADGEAEYIELVNLSGVPVTMSDPTTGLCWRLTGERRGLDMLIQTGSALALQPGKKMILTRNKAAFDSIFTVPGDVLVLEWVVGGLGDDGDDIRLFRPDGLDDSGQVRWILVDRVRYSDGTHPKAGQPDQWPQDADGQGKALGRISITGYGNDPANWQAVDPSPGH